MQRKKRILHVGEFSGLNTGYATISKNLLAEFVRTGKYEVAELAGYMKETDHYHQQLARQFPWKIYGNMPVNDQEQQIYNSHPQNEFGRWKFDFVCSNFQPDIVISFRDFWMDSFMDQSIFRKFFKTVMMPTVDGRSQNLEWVDFYIRQDHILTYTDFAYKVLQEEGGGLIPLRGVATPAVDIDIFKPVTNKKQHKEQFGLDPNSIIVGMVARNQRRKMFPDLIEAFQEFLGKAHFKETNNIYLYLHTAHPDLGWDLPKYIKENGLSHKVLMTYFCHNCRRWFPSFYQDALTICRFCGQKSAPLSNSQIGIATDALSAIYNFMDLYVQFVTNEGLGIPCLEAAACGCPFAATNYSGTEDLIANLSGKPISPRTLFHEAETSRILSYPSIDELVEYISEFVSLPESIRMRMSRSTAELVRQHYGGWESVAKRWMDIFDSIEIPQQNPWASPIDIVPTTQIPIPPADRMSDEQFVGWCLGEILHRPDWINSYCGLKILRDLSWGRTIVNNLGFFFGEMSQLSQKTVWEPCDRNKIMQFVKGLREQYNNSEQMRQNYILSGKINNV